MRIVVTGGAGFIGSHLSRRLVDEGHRVAVVDNLDDYYAPALKRADLRQLADSTLFSFQEADICDSSRIEQVFTAEQPEAVIHLAARVGVRPSLERPLDYEETNVRGTMIILEAARRWGVGKFLFASSSSVYGNTRRVPFTEEDHQMLPISPYAATKIAGEKMCYAYSHLYALPVICLRLFTVYGPRQRPDLAIHKFAKLIDAGRAVPFYGDGNTARDYTYIDDIVEGFHAALRLDERYEVINLGNSHPVRLTELISVLEEKLGKQAILERLPPQPGGVNMTCADISKAARLLGYSPRTSLPEGIGKFVECLRQR